MLQASKIKTKIIILISCLAVISLFILIWIQIPKQLPDFENLESFIPSETTLIYSCDGKILARFHQEENRQVIPLSKISPHLIKLLIATEDAKFYSHHGIDFSGIFRAAVKNLIYGRILEGGSTITQQLARNIFLTREKSITRKIAEALLAVQLERKYTKEEILELYLNQVYLGHNTYGIESAASLYFGKHASQLNLAESAMIIGLIRGPEIYSPYRNLEAAKNRQNYVLKRAVEHGYITEEKAVIVATEPLEFCPNNLRRYGDAAPYFISHVLQELLNKYGEDMVYNGGLKVYTTLDSHMQSSAEAIITKFASTEGEKYHFSQVALLAIDPRTGYIKAMVGGVDFNQSKFNRAIQAKRQPGSAFKPFVYATAMELGISPGTVILDAMTTFEVFPNEWNPEGTWTPLNFDKKFRGPVTLRYALEKSLNIPAVKILEQVGINPVINLAHRMGIQSKIEPGLALPLGVSEVSLLELTSAYGVFANSGIRVEPTAIIKIENRDGVVLSKNVIEEKRVLDQNVSALMVDLMKGVLTRGTGVRGMLSRPAAAKTGTTEEFKDAWFVGYVPQLVTGVWVGNDDNTTMEGVAEVAVCPRIWKEFNLNSLAGTPVEDFPKPEGMVEARICLQSGKLAGPYCPVKDQVTDTFFEKDVPQEKCDVHNFDLSSNQSSPPGIEEQSFNELYNH